VGDSSEEHPERLDAVVPRRQLLRDLCRKYGEDLAEVAAYRQEASRRLAELEGFEQRAADLDERRREAVADERATATIVGRARRAAAPELAAAVAERLHDLALPHATIVVEVGTGPDDHPGDDVQFLLAANPGSPPLPLVKVASGGELARTMLALRLVSTALDDHARVLVFDEVDAGIGGNAAAAVGRALGEVAGHHQVLVVTHLAQVAAQATAQVAVTKTVDGAVTTATATTVTGDRRVDEIARMLSGAEGGAAARRHARQLLTG
jgi:DNA repair protein RecN (Recombination protein N)